MASHLSFADRKEWRLREMRRGFVEAKLVLRNLLRRNLNWRQTRQFVDGEFRPLICEAA
jgi:hypothetical protein